MQRSILMGMERSTLLSCWRELNNSRHAHAHKHTNTGMLARPTARRHVHMHTCSPARTHAHTCPYACLPTRPTAQPHAHRGLHGAGFTPAEVENLKERVSALYAEDFVLDFDLFLQIVCPNTAVDLGELCYQLKFRQTQENGRGQLFVAIQKAIQLTPMDDGRMSDPYVIIKVAHMLTHTRAPAQAQMCTHAPTHATHVRFSRSVTSSETRA